MFVATPSSLVFSSPLSPPPFFLSFPLTNKGTDVEACTFKTTATGSMMSLLLLPLLLVLSSLSFPFLPSPFLFSFFFFFGERVPRQYRKPARFKMRLGRANYSITNVHSPRLLISLPFFPIFLPFFRFFPFFFFLSFHIIKLKRTQHLSGGLSWLRQTHSLAGLWTPGELFFLSSFVPSPFPLLFPFFFFLEK